MFTAVLLLCALVSSAWLWLWHRDRRILKLLGHLPSYSKLPILGNLHHFSGGPELVFRRIQEMSRISEEKQLPFMVWLGPSPALVISNPEDVAAISNTFLEKPYYYGFGRDWMGNGLVTAPVSIWKRNIKKLAGTFNGAVVEGYQPVFNEQARKLTSKLKNKVGSAPFDILNDLAFTTLESICQTALGVPQVSEYIVTDEYYHAFNKAAELIMKRAFNLVMHLDFVYKLTPGYRELTRCLDVVHSISNTIIKERRQEWEESKKKRTGPEPETAKPWKNKIKSFLDILLELSDNDPHLTLAQIRDEVDTIIVGGQETGATALFYALLMLGCKKDVQDKLYAEMYSIFGDSDRTVEKEDLLRMPYCEAVILESLRLFPPLPAVMRLADRDLQLKSCVIPKGASCVINGYGAGRSATFWGPDAQEFRPEWWLGPSSPYTHSAAFLAFSYGRRACIGKKYAMPLLKTLLAWCVRELRFASEADHLKLKFDVVLRPLSGHLIQVYHRKPQEKTIVVPK